MSTGEDFIDGVKEAVRFDHGVEAAIVEDIEGIVATVRQEMGFDEADSSGDLLEGAFNEAVFIGAGRAQLGILLSEKDATVIGFSVAERLVPPNHYHNGLEITLASATQHAYEAFLQRKEKEEQ